MKVSSIVLLLFFSIILIGQNVEVMLTPNQIMIGDHMDLTLRVQNARNTIFPNIDDTSMGNFRLVEALKPDTLYSGSNVTISKRYIITCFEDSTQLFPALAFHQGLNTASYSKPIQIMVGSPNVDTAKEIRPIKNIILVPLSKKEIFSYLFVSLILLGAVLLIYFIYVRYIRKENLFDIEKPEDPPHVAALKSLKETETLGLWQKGNTKQYYDNISDIIRLYIEKRFGIKALEQTTVQILSGLKALDLPEDIVQNMEDLLQLSDLAKFAKETPDENANTAILQYAYQFIQDTQMSYDANKKANALQVRKFYAQNKYGYKRAAINQESFRILAYGLIASFSILALMILLAYLVPINSLLGIIANNPVEFFLGIILAGILWTLIVMYWRRKSMESSWIIFDYNSIILRKKNSQQTIPFAQIIGSKMDKKSNLIFQEIGDKEHTISKKMEYFDEIKERIIDIIDIEHKPTVSK